MRKKIVEENEYTAHAKISSLKEGQRYETDNETIMRLIENTTDEIISLKQDIQTLCDMIAGMEKEKLITLNTVKNYIFIGLFLLVILIVVNL